MAAQWMETCRERSGATGCSKDRSQMQVPVNQRLTKAASALYLYGSPEFGTARNCSRNSRPTTKFGVGSLRG